MTAFHPLTDVAKWNSDLAGDERGPSSGLVR
jgi:hypothetical protein